MPRNARAQLYVSQDAYNSVGEYDTITAIATILLDSGLVPIDQVQKFLGHMHLSTTQIYAETACGLSGRTISGRWEESGSRRMRF